MLKTDATSQRASDAVVRALSEAMDVPQTELPPLYDAVDPDALDRFTRDAPSGSELGFDYCGTVVTVAVREAGLDVTVAGRSQ
jgi:hypothetical protein